MFTLLFLLLAAAGGLIVLVALMNPDMTGMPQVMGLSERVVRALLGKRAEWVYLEVIRWVWVGIGAVMALAGLTGAAFNLLRKW